MAFNKPINIFSRLGYDPTTEMSAKLLGKLSNVSWAYARIRTNPDRRSKCLEFEVLIDIRYLERNPLRLHDTTLGVAKGVIPKALYGYL